MATSLMRKKFAALFKRGDNATTADAKGDALEEIVVCLFSTTKGVPGGLIRRNELNKQVSQEIDIAIWNDRHPQGLPFLPDTVVAECKNWDAPVGSSAIDAFVAKLKD